MSVSIHYGNDQSIDLGNTIPALKAIQEIIVNLKSDKAKLKRYRDIVNICDYLEQDISGEVHVALKKQASDLLGEESLSEDAQWLLNQIVRS